MGDSEGPNMETRSMKEPRLHYAEWIDSAASGRWTRLDDFKEGAAYIKTIGWLCFEDDECITLAGSYGPETEHVSGQVNCFVTIPKVSLKEFYPIKISKTK